MSVAVTQIESRDLATDTKPNVHVTQAEAKTVGAVPSPTRRMTQVYANLIGIRLNYGNGAPSTGDNVSVTQLEARVLTTFTPNFEWIDMFIDEEFPHDISFNSIGATRFQTDVVMVDSGHDQRNSRWDQPLMEYDVAYGVRTMEHLHDLIAFFRVMKGKTYSFLYHDVVDHKSTLAKAEEARRAPDISPLDQQIGVGDEKTKTFQLVKHYPTPRGMSVHTRPIYKPKPGTVSIAINGQTVTWWNVDPLTGRVTFVPRHAVTNVQNCSITQHATIADRWVIAAAPGTFTGFNVNERIIMRGWVNPLNNTTESVRVPILSKATDGSSITVRLPAEYGSNESSVNGVAFTSHPAPDVGAIITAGFEFYVPVRFDTDRLPVSLEEYGIGGAADVKLVEVRPAEE